MASADYTFWNTNNNKREGKRMETVIFLIEIDEPNKQKPSKKLGWINKVIENLFAVFSIH